MAVGKKIIRSGLAFEVFLASVIVISIALIIRFVMVEGYLPSPFFNDTTDTFMDWYNTAYWAHHGGAFEFWGSVYPPMAILFVKIFSVGACYATSSEFGRSCDRTAVFVLSALLLINTVLSYKALKKAGIDAAVPRAIALGLGAPMLLAWERGNVIIPAYTFFILGYGRLLRPGWLKLLCTAVTINFKPYLVVLLFPNFIRRRWRALEWIAVFCAVIYAVSYTLLGEGGLFALLQDLMQFGKNFALPSIWTLRFAITYHELLEIVQSPYPLMRYVGSRPIEFVETWAPLIASASLLGIVACFVGALLRPTALSSNRLSALTMCFLYTVNSPGGYALDFVLLFVFLESWKGGWRMIVPVFGYLLCLPFDVTIYHFGYQLGRSYLTGRTVQTDLALTVSEFFRPAFFLSMEFGLIATSVFDLVRWRDRLPPALVTPRASAADGAVASPA